MFHRMMRSEMDTPELEEAVQRASQLTSDKNRIRINFDAIIAVVDQILLLSRKNKKWYLYFYALNHMLYLQSEYDGGPRLLPYAEVFYRDARAYFDRILPEYENTNIKLYYIGAFSWIFQAYKEFYQIDDARLALFIQMYRENVERYGNVFDYYQSLLRLALIHRDKAMAREAMEGMKRFEQSASNCYVCKHLPIMGYYLLMGDTEEAEEYLGRLLHRRIPKRYQWCYNGCNLADTEGLYSVFLGYALLTGNTEAFRRNLPHYTRLGAEGLDWDTHSCFLMAASGAFPKMEDAFALAVEDVVNAKNHTTMSAIYDSLCWYLYFSLLHRAGTERVALGADVPESLPAPGAGGKHHCLELAAWFENMADGYGAKFDSSRRLFRYAALKESYKACAGL